MSQIVWASLDPVRRKIDIYPLAIANRIEKSYTERNPYNTSSCVLGADFFNATVHFHPSGIQYQTTPGVYIGRAGFKQSGYRSVKRCNVVDGSITIYSKQDRGQWRITHNEPDSETLYNMIPSPNDIINTDNLGENVNIGAWTLEDLASESLDTLVVVWQWCQQTDRDVSKYLDTNWRPYNADVNTLIEQAFSSNLMRIKIDLPVIGERNIRFYSRECYASQVSLDNTKVRSVRRVVKTIQELKEMFSYISTLPEDYSEIVKNLPDGEVPHHYCCPILQEIMTDPVKTVDGFTYERYAIETWFQHKLSSPLTGLPLLSDTLISNDELAKNIKEFIKQVKETES